MHYIESAAGFEAETIKQASVSKIVIGAKTTFSILLEEAIFPSVLKAMNAVIIQENIRMNIGTGNPPKSPAR